MLYHLCGKSAQAAGTMKIKLKQLKILINTRLHSLPEISYHMKHLSSTSLWVNKNPNQ